MVLQTQLVVNVLFYSLLALAACAQEYNYTRPTISEDNVIEIEAGRSVGKCFAWLFVVVQHDIQQYLSYIVTGHYGRRQIFTCCQVPRPLATRVLSHAKWV